MPTDKLTARFPRILANLKLAIAELPHVIVLDNSDLAHPYRQLALFDHGQTKEIVKPVPTWLRAAV